MTIIALVQSGEHGPVRPWPANNIDALQRAIDRVQVGNPDTLLIREVIDATPPQAGPALHAALRPHADPAARDDWYAPQALEHIPDDLGRIDFDRHGQQAKLALIQLRRLATRSA